MIYIFQTDCYPRLIKWRDYLLYIIGKYLSSRNYYSKVFCGFLIVLYKFNGLVILWFVVLYIIIAVSFFDIPFYKLLEYFLINESEPYMLKENQSAYTLVSSTTAGKDELIKGCKYIQYLKVKYIWSHLQLKMLYFLITYLSWKRW